MSRCQRRTPSRRRRQQHQHHPLYQHLRSIKLRYRAIIFRYRAWWQKSRHPHAHLAPAIARPMDALRYATPATPSQTPGLAYVQRRNQVGPQPRRSTVLAPQNLTAIQITGNVNTSRTAGRQPTLWPDNRAVLNLPTPFGAREFERHKQHSLQIPKAAGRQCDNTH